MVLGGRCTKVSLLYFNSNGFMLSLLYSVFLCECCLTGATIIDGQNWVRCNPDTAQCGWTVKYVLNEGFFSGN